MLRRAVRPWRSVGPRHSSETGPSPGASIQSSMHHVAGMHLLVAEHPESEVVLLLLSVEPTRHPSYISAPRSSRLSRLSRDGHWASSRPLVVHCTKPRNSESAILLCSGSATREQRSTGVRHVQIWGWRAEQFIVASVKCAHHREIPSNANKSSFPTCPMRMLAGPYQWGAGLLSGPAASRRPIQERAFVLSPSAQIPGLETSCNTGPLSYPSSNKPITK